MHDTRIQSNTKNRSNTITMTLRQYTKLQKKTTMLLNHKHTKIQNIPNVQNTTQHKL